MRAFFASLPLNACTRVFPQKDGSAARRREGAGSPNSRSERVTFCGEEARRSKQAALSAGSALRYAKSAPTTVAFSFPKWYSRKHQ